MFWFVYHHSSIFPASSFHSVLFVTWKMISHFGHAVVEEEEGGHFQVAGLLRKEQQEGIVIFAMLSFSLIFFISVYMISNIDYSFSFSFSSV